ncbi:MAG: Uma2 family endonuclease [Planctomycetota bacterium]
MTALPNSPTRLSYDEFMRLPDDGQRHELIDGEHFVSAAPATRHQYISARVFFQLFEQIVQTSRGEVFAAPTDLQFSKSTVVQPDVVVLLAERESILNAHRIEGAPNLVIEILSNSTSHVDRTHKRRAYARHGVPEYWIVDPAAEVVEQHVLSTGRYQLVGTHHDTIVCATIPNVVLNLADVWPPPNHPVGKRAQ